MKKERIFNSLKATDLVIPIQKGKQKAKSTMKRLVFLILLLLPFFHIAKCQTDTIIRVYGNNNTLNVSFILPSYEIRDTSFMDLYGIAEIFNYIQIDDEFGIIDSVGLPQLPQLSFDLYMPFNATDFEIEIISVETTNIRINRKIMPAQEDIEKSNPVFNFLKNNRYYSSSGGFCNSFVQLKESFIVFGEQGINLTIFPFIYNPAQDSLTVLNSIVFVVSHTSSRRITEEYHSEAKDNYLNMLFKNYGNINRAANKGRYLMITAPDYESTLTYFANYKRNIGFDVVVVNTNTISNSPITVTAIKNYIQNQYNNVSTRPDYVLLVGDVDKIPAYEGDAAFEPDRENPITDLGYSLLDGSDNLADVFLGRFSVSDENGNDELKNIINKTIFMEMNMHRFEKKSKFLTGYDDSQYMMNQFKKGHEYVIPYSFEYLDYDCQRLYQPNLTSVVNALSDNPLFFIYSGHGSVISFAFGNMVSFQITDVISATNTVFPIVFAFACVTGHFARHSFGEEFIREKKGAVAFLGSSVNSLTNSDNAIEKKIFGDAFKKDEQNLSAIINLGKRRFTYVSGISKKNKEIYLKAYNLLGDPSFDTKGIGCKQSFTFNYPDVFKSGSEITYRADDFIKNNNDFVVESGAKVNLLAGNFVILKPGFEAKAGSEVHIQIVPCDAGTIRDLSIANDSEENSEDTLNVRMIKYDIIQQEEELINPALFSIFPNPTTDDFSLAYTLENNGFVQIDLYNMSGTHIKTFLQLSEQETGVYYYNFSLSGLSTGLYVLVFKTASKTISNKIIKH